MRFRLKSALSCASTCLLVSLIVLSFMSARVYASTQILYKSGYFEGWQKGGSGDYWETSADTSGNHRAYCYKNSNAWALIEGEQTYTGMTLTQIDIQVSVKNAYVYKNAPWFSTAIAKFWVKFIDATTGQVLFEDRSRDYSSTQGLYWYHYVFTATVQSGHTYSLLAGAYVQTGYGWFWQYGTAEARGTIDVMLVTGNP